MNTMSDGPAVSLGYVLFYVRDVAKTAAFWQEAFGLTLKFAHESGEYAELSTGATTLGFVGDTLMQQQGVKYRANSAEGEPGGAQVSLVTAAPEQLVARATARGARTVKAVEQKPWGQKSGIVLDENGILVEICSPVEHG